jgi:hypothetical protein
MTGGKVWEMHIVYIHCDAVRGTLWGRGIISSAVITTNLLQLEKRPIFVTGLTSTVL